VLAGEVSTTALARTPKPSRTADVPVNFVGMNVGDAIYARGVDPNQQLNKIVASGVESIRVTFDWSEAQPYHTWSQVPMGQAAQFQGDPVPTDFTSSDQIVSMAARRGLSVLPVVLNAPAWDATPTTQMVGAPLYFGPYVSYVEALVHRYGPHGSFWSSHRSVPYRPIRQWQIWNEPDLIDYWSFTPWVRTYVSLLKQSSAAIKAIDPKAKVVLAGMPNYVWRYLNAIYRIRGARKAFDEVAVHPYTANPRGIITILQRVRAVMNRHGDRHKPLIATELGWPSSSGKSFQHFSFATTEAGQARKLAALMPLIARDRVKLGLAGFYYYTWMDYEFTGAPAFNFAGLFAYHSDGTVTTKPVYRVFRRWALKLTGRHRRALASRP
jgi:hypothetical protein